MHSKMLEPSLARAPCHAHKTLVAKTSITSSSRIDCGVYFKMVSRNLGASTRHAAFVFFNDDKSHEFLVSEEGKFALQRCEKFLFSGLGVKSGKDVGHHLKIIYLTERKTHKNSILDEKVQENDTRSGRRYFFTSVPQTSYDREPAGTTWGHAMWTRDSQPVRSSYAVVGAGRTSAEQKRS